MPDILDFKVVLISARSAYYSIPSIAILIGFEHSSVLSRKPGMKIIGHNYAKEKMKCTGFIHGVLSQVQVPDSKW
jgi:hypothetical protein